MSASSRERSACIGSDLQHCDCCVQQHPAKNSSIVALFPAVPRRFEQSWLLVLEHSRGRFSIGSQTDVLETLEIHECRSCLHNVVRESFVATLHEGATRGTMQEIQCCQDVCVTATVQEEIVQLTHRDRCRRMDDSRVPVWCFHHDTKHAAVTEWKVRRIVFRDLVCSGQHAFLANACFGPHPAQLRCLPQATVWDRYANLPVSPVPAREPVTTNPPSSDRVSKRDPDEFP